LCGEEHSNKNARKVKEKAQKDGDKDDTESIVVEAIASDCPAWCGGGEGADEAAVDNVQPNE
jgi:hypothetical protein